MCYKWGHFRQHCSKEYRTGETCGMKLVMSTYPSPDKCKICSKIDIKERAIGKEEAKIKRWRHEHNRRASIEKAEQEICRYYGELNVLYTDKERKQMEL